MEKAKIVDTANDMQDASGTAEFGCSHVGIDENMYIFIQTQRHVASVGVNLQLHPVEWVPFRRRKQLAPWSGMYMRSLVR